MIEVIYPNGDDPNKRKERPIESIVEDINFCLMDNTQNGAPAYTLDQVARDQGLENVQELLRTNKSVRNLLETFIDLNEQGAFKFYENRADVNFLAMFLDQARPLENKQGK